MAKKQPKFKTLTELAEAFRREELSRYEWSLRLDNDNMHLTFVGPVPEGVDPNDFESEKYDEGYTLFNCNTGVEAQAVELFRLAGIPAEWC